jgi:hypothetical protein
MGAFWHPGTVHWFSGTLAAYCARQRAITVVGLSFFGQWFSYGSGLSLEGPLLRFPPCFRKKAKRHPAGRGPRRPPRPRSDPPRAFHSARASERVRQRKTLLARSRRPKIATSGSRSFIIYSSIGRIPAQNPVFDRLGTPVAIDQRSAPGHVSKGTILTSFQTDIIEPKFFQEIDPPGCAVS